MQLNMREIKFRALTQANNIMVYGSIDTMYNGSCFISYWESVLIEPENNFYEMMQDFKEVQKSTIGQFIGLKDKNGFEIYEGDILKKESHLIVAFTNEKVKNSDHENWYKVIWNDEYSNWSLETVKTTRKNNFGIGYQFNFKIKNHIDKMEIVGNIYQNPELLSNE